MPSGATAQSSAYLITRYGGLRSFGAILGINSSVIGLAMGFGPWFAGKVFDVTGSYQLVLTGRDSLRHRRRIAGDRPWPLSGFHGAQGKARRAWLERSRAR